MKIKINKTQVEVPDKDLEEFLSKYVKKDAGQEMSLGSEYYGYSPITDEILDATHTNHPVDLARMELGLVSLTEVGAQAIQEKWLAWRRIQRYIIDNGLVFEPDWNDNNQRKLELSYSFSNDRLLAMNLYTMKNCSMLNIYFQSEEDAQQVIDNCSDDLRIVLGVK